MTAKQKRDALVREGGYTPDEAAHMLADMGEVTIEQHKALLSRDERKRVYAC